MLFHQQQHRQNEWAPTVRLWAGRSVQSRCYANHRRRITSPGCRSNKTIWLAVEPLRARDPDRKDAVLYLFCITQRPQQELVVVDEHNFIQLSTNGILDRPANAIAPPLGYGVIIVAR